MPRHPCPSVQSRMDAKETGCIPSPPFRCGERHPLTSPPQAPYVPNAMDILDGIADLPPEFLLIKLHLRRRARDGGSGPILLPGLGTRASSGVVGET